MQVNQNKKNGLIKHMVVKMIKNEIVEDINNNYLGYIQRFKDNGERFDKLTKSLLDLKENEDKKVTLSTVIIAMICESYQELLNVEYYSHMLSLDESEKEQLKDSWKKCNDSLTELRNVDYFNDGTLINGLNDLLSPNKVTLSIKPSESEYVLTKDYGGQLKLIKNPYSNGD